MSVLAILGGVAATLIGAPVTALSIVSAVDSINEEREKDARRRRREAKNGHAAPSSVPSPPPAAQTQAHVPAVSQRRRDGLRDLVGDQQRRVEARHERARQEQERAARANQAAAAYEEPTPAEFFADWVRHCIIGTRSEHDVIQAADLINSYIDYCKRRGSSLLDKEEFLRGLIYFSESQGFVVVEGGAIVYGRLQEG